MPASETEQYIRAALLQHWAASDANDFGTEHQIYCDDAILGIDSGVWACVQMMRGSATARNRHPVAMRIAAGSHSCHRCQHKS